MAEPSPRSYRQERFEDSNPELAALSAEAVAWLAASGRDPVVLEPGARFEVPPGDFLLVVEGLFLLEPEQGDERTARAFFVVGLLESVLRRPTRVRVTALHQVRAYPVAAAELAALRPQLPWLRAYQRALAEHQVRELWEELEASRKHLQDAWVPDTASLIPGPYRCRGAELLLLLLESEEEGWVGAQLPPGVLRSPPCGQRFLLVLAHFRDVTCEHPAAGGARFDYRETTVFLPCLAFGWPGAFAPILFPDSTMAILLGREVYGFPKRFGKTTLDMPRRYAELEVDDRLSFWCEWGEPEEVSAERFADRFVEVMLGDGCMADKVGDLAGPWFKRLFGADVRQPWPPASVFVRRRVPDVALPGDRGLIWQEDALVRVPFDVDAAHGFQLLPDPHLVRVRAGFLPPCRPLLAGRVLLDMAFGVRQELCGYTGPIARARLEARALRRTALRYGELARRVVGRPRAG